MVNELKVINQNGKLLTDSREVAKMVSKEHSKLLRDIRNYCKYLNEANFGLVEYFIETTYKDSKNEERKCYLVTKKGCEMIANKMIGKKGVLFTATYVDAFNKMEESLRQITTYKLPQTYAEALRELADKAEENEKLKEENYIMLPKAEFYDAVTKSEDTIDMGECAKVLNMGIGRNNLFKFLREHDVLMSNNVPYQRFVDGKYFRTIENKFEKPNGEIKINVKTVVYQKGLDYIRKLLKKYYI
ncbi:Rha family transcriptional regulator [Clostridium haemolyticum]|uniref:Antirepressor protein n=1 Tax=Clostridium haemolyticum NCTC 9693 TaxID=1443114 RepID=A0ABR4TBH9_CLOHA|nr:phage regulatory protein/antirepressor Ant [Clostridium haemolyticum]KEI14169.1 putative antirepressor protein [Clostridium haemolyticum NCTC 9693]